MTQESAGCEMEVGIYLAQSARNRGWVGSPPGSPSEGSQYSLSLPAGKIFVDGLSNQSRHRLAGALLLQPEASQVLWQDARAVVAHPLDVVLRYVERRGLDLSNHIAFCTPAWEDPACQRG